MKNVLLTVAYDGSGFSGWQIQEKKDQRTVQGELEKALMRLTGQTVRVLASGRTDAGVHALAQPVQFSDGSTIPVEAFVPALNSTRPQDVRVMGARQVPEEFHVIRDAVAKTYLYRIRLSADPDPFTRNFCWQYPYPVNFRALEESATLLEGTHDFRAFCASGSSARNFVRTIYRLSLEPADRMLEIRVRGNGFLYNMVRIIVGTLMAAGQGRLDPERITEALETGRRDLLGPTAPPRGLYLQGVEYPEQCLNQDRNLPE